MSFLLGFQYWTILPESREIWVRLGSDWRLHAGWFSPQPLWATLHLVGCPCTMPINPLATFSCWLVSIFPYPPSILHPTLPWEAALYAPHNLDSIALWLWLGLERERCGKGMEVRRRKRLGYLHSLLSFCPSPVLAAAVFLHDHSSCPEAFSRSFSSCWSWKPRFPPLFFQDLGW